jgi:hypothetical protein
MKIDVTNHMFAMRALTDFFITKRSEINDKINDNFSLIEDEFKNFCDSFIEYKNLIQILEKDFSGLFFSIIMSEDKFQKILNESNILNFKSSDLSEDDKRFLNVKRTYYNFKTSFINELTFFHKGLDNIIPCKRQKIIHSNEEFSFENKNNYPTYTQLGRQASDGSCL